MRIIWNAGCHVNQFSFDFHFNHSPLALAGREENAEYEETAWRSVVNNRIRWGSTAAPE